MSATDRWLEPRIAALPPELAGAVSAAVARVASRERPVPVALAETALDELDAALAVRQDRGAALRLLAADALLTYAFEASVDPEIGGTAALASRLAEQVGPAGLLGARLAAGRGPGAGRPASG